MAGSRQTPSSPESLDLAYQLRIVLQGTDPAVWRLIQVPGSSTFWDLHVAIQDAMGWEDSHLHVFSLRDPRSNKAVQIGIPDGDDVSGSHDLAGWKVQLADLISAGLTSFQYCYDFGDDWLHSIELESSVQAEDASVPKCLAGANACPPEDVGGVFGYQEFLVALKDRKHPEHKEVLAWIGRDFDPHSFAPETVVFSDSGKRLEALKRSLRK